MILRPMYLTYARTKLKYRAYTYMDFQVKRKFPNLKQRTIGQQSPHSNVSKTSRFLPGLVWRKASVYTAY